MPPCAAATSGWYSVATSRSTVAPAPVTCLIMAGPSCCERYDEFLLDQPRVTLLRTAYLVTPDNPAPSSILVILFCSSPRRQASPGCREGPVCLSGRRRAVAAPPRCNIYSTQEGRFLTRWSMPH